MLTPSDARDAILAGQTVRMRVGESAEDPTLLLYLDDGMIYSKSIAGWSEGITEPMCASESDYLRMSLSKPGRTLTLED